MLAGVATHPPTHPPSPTCISLPIFSEIVRTTGCIATPVAHTQAPKGISNSCGAGGAPRGGRERHSRGRQEGGQAGRQATWRPWEAHLHARTHTSSVCFTIECCLLHTAYVVLLIHDSHAVGGHRLDARVEDEVDAAALEALCDNTGEHGRCGRGDAGQAQVKLSMGGGELGLRRCA